MTALHDLSAEVLSNAYRARQLSPVEVTRAALARIDAWEAKINAMYVVAAESALAQAAAAEARWRAGTPLSALDGVPITIKDNIAMAGMPTPVGTAAGDMTASASDAPPAARVREAGCVVIGKTTMPDYGMLVSGVSSLHGITRNPWDLARNPGGSSSGAGAGMAAGYAPLALGTDIGGSVRLPAAYNGVFALKPSLGRIPIYPPFLGRTVGPITRTVDGCGAPDDGADAARPTRLHGIAVRGDRLAGIAGHRRPRQAARPRPRHRRRHHAAAGGARRRRGGGRRLRARRRHRRAGRAVRDAGDVRRARPLLPGAPVGRGRAARSGPAGRRCCRSSWHGAGRPRG